ARIVDADYLNVPAEDFVDENIVTEQELAHAIAQLEEQMREAAKKFEFERAAALRDRVRALKQRDIGALFVPAPAAKPDAGPPAADPPVSKAS
ncbi:MAG: UvrB/UvrC motif-containing protein, partial [Candidatus Acidiferrales bacterium]